MSTHLSTECSARRIDATGNADRFLDDYYAAFGDTEDEADWNVFHVEPHQGWSDHHSLYLAQAAGGGHGDVGIVIEPSMRGNCARKLGSSVAARILFFDPDVHGRLTRIKLGCTRMSGSAIIHAALDAVGNTCTEVDYCSKLSKALGCSELSPVARGSGVLSTVTSAAFGVYQMFSRSSKPVTKDKKKA